MNCLRPHDGTLDPRGPHPITKKDIVHLVNGAGNNKENGGPPPVATNHNVNNNPVKMRSWSSSHVDSLGDSNNSKASLVSRGAQKKALRKRALKGNSLVLQLSMMHLR